MRSDAPKREASVTPETLNHLLAEARRLAMELANRAPMWVRDLEFGQGMRRVPSDRTPPEDPGVYLFRKEQTVLYIGRTKRTGTLRKRICSDHLSTGQRHSKDFRDKVATHEDLMDSEGNPDRIKVLQRMRECYSVAWVQITSPEMRAVVESLLIAWARADNQQLLNDQYGD